MDPIKVGPRDLILLAGLPGAGKSTLLAGLRDVPEITVRDSDELRVRLGSRVPSWLPYRAYRPLVHAGHQVRVLTAALRSPGPVLVHDPATRAVTRTALAALARLSGRPAVFLWLDVSAPEALDGQRARGRILPPRSFARHVARADMLRDALFSGAVPPGWRCVVLLDRTATHGGLRVAVGEVPMTAPADPSGSAGVDTPH